MTWQRSGIKSQSLPYAMAEALRLFRCAAGGPDWGPLPCACASCAAVEVRALAPANAAAFFV
jgi:hypothetical protein